MLQLDNINLGNELTMSTLSIRQQSIMDQLHGQKYCLIGVFALYFDVTTQTVLLHFHPIA